jgi:uncharacterized protein with HEPN domain
MSKDPRFHIAYILECAQKIQRFTADGRERFSQDVMVQDTVILFTVGGIELCRVDPSTKTKPNC